jgi:hypothetical protein
MVERLYPKEKQVTTVETGTKLLRDLLQNVKKDFSVSIEEQLKTLSKDRTVWNLKVNGPCKVDLDTGIIVFPLMMIMMASGSVQMKNQTELGTTMKDPVPMESGQNGVLVEHGLQILMMNLSDSSYM